MPRAIRVLGPAERHDRPVVDTVILDYARRSAPDATVTGVKGGTYEIALVELRRLDTDDLLELEDGTLVEVVAAPEPLLELRAADLAGLARLAWQLGDRHVPVQVLTNRIRVQAQAGVAELLAALGAKVTPLEAPFDPEGGAYASAHAHHDHAHHDHAHGHDHGPAHDHHHRDH